MRSISLAKDQPKKITPKEIEWACLREMRISDLLR
jgi:hypothetical protein